MRRVLLAVLFAAVVAAGCGGDADKSPAAAGGGTASSRPGPAGGGPGGETSVPAAAAAANPAPGATGSPGARPGTAGVTDTDQLEKREPLIQSLPRSTTHYKIDYTVGADKKTLSLKISLFAILNNASQLSQYKAQLSEYKAEALAWLRSKGENPSDYKITYEPPEAATL